MRVRAPLFLALASAFHAACAAPPVDVGAPRQRVQREGLTLVFDGAFAFGAERLAAVVAEDLERLPEAPNRRAVLDDAAFALQRFFRRQGFADAEVGFAERSETRVRFDVREGPRVLVESIELRGVRELPAEDLVELYDAPRVGDRRAFVAGAVADLARSIESRYVARGFAQVDVAEPAIEREPGADLARVTIEVREGRVYRIGPTTWIGDAGALREELDDLARRERGAAYTSAAVGTLCARAAELFAERGHPEARVRPHEETLNADGSVALDLEVEPGPHVTVAAIEVRGLERVDRDLVLSRVAFRAGRPWRASDERDTLRDLFRTGLFASVELDLEGTGGERVLVVRVREASSRELSFEPGYGSYERLRLGIGWRDRNWLGTGRALNVEGAVSELAQRASATLVDLRLFESDLEGAVSIFGGRRVEPSFTSTDLGGSVTFTRPFTTRLRGIAGYQFRRSGVGDVSAGVSATELGEDVNIGSVTLTGAWDDRDQYFVPTRGTFAQLSCELAAAVTGSELDFARTRWSTSHFVALGERNVLGASWRGGVIAPLEGTQTIPLQERFFNGGENTVRAFHEKEIGPQDRDGKPLGGEAFQVLSLELRRELGGNLDGALFWDAGTVQSDAGDFLSFDDLRHGPGIGLRYRLPIGPVRLDLGHNPAVRDEESRWVLHLSVGMSF